MAENPGVFRHLRWYNHRSDGVFQQSDSGRLPIDVMNWSYVYRSTNPNWKNEVRSPHTDASRPYERLDFTWYPQISHTHYVNQAWWPVDPLKYDVDVYDVFSGTLPSYLYDDADTRDLALARLKRKLSSRSNQVNVLIPAVELHELRGTIRSLVYLTQDLVYALIMIKKSKGKSAYQYAADAWLQYSFAIKPTLSDFKAIKESIDDFLKSSKDSKFTDYGAARREDQIVNNNVYGFGLPAANQNGNLVVNRRLSYRFTCGYNVPTRGSNNYGADIQFGIEPGALVPAMWELTSFSWLVDYFSTVGAYLEDTFVTDPVDTIYVNETKRIVCMGQFSLNPPTTVGGRMLTSSVSTGGSAFRISYTQRKVLAKLPTRALRFKSSDEIGKNAINKLLNLSSILVGGSSLSKRKSDWTWLKP